MIKKLQKKYALSEQGAKEDVYKRQTSGCP